MLSLKSIAATLGLISLVTAVTNDLSTYPRCDAEQIEKYALTGGSSDEPIVLWRHFDGNGSVYDGNDIVCVFTLADSKLADLEGTSITKATETGLYRRHHYPKCVGDVCLDGKECKLKGCKQGCLTWYQCAPEDCSGLSTACI